MKAKALQFGKAISAALFVLLLVVVGSKNALAQNQVATLQHGEDISVFYGQNAFVDAHSAATTGDIITLSSGTFTPTDITKAITLRGAGCVIDTVTGIYPTIIPNTFQMNVTNDTAFLTVEGIYFSGTVNRKTLNHPQFIKCNFETLVRGGTTGNMQNAQFVNCKLKNLSFSSSSNTTLINCVIWDAVYLNNTSTTVTAYNCNIRFSSVAQALNAYNCFLIPKSNSSNNYYLCENSVAYNCIELRPSNNPSVFNGIPAYNCGLYNTYASVFETFTGSFSFDEPFILKEEIATGFLGTDGTEIGIHGGIMPYSSRPSYMVIEQCNVANRSTIDGKLSVEIEVVTEEE